MTVNHTPGSAAILEAFDHVLTLGEKSECDATLCNSEITSVIYIFIFFFAFLFLDDNVFFNIKHDGYI